MNFQFTNFKIFKQFLFCLIFLSGFLVWGKAEADFSVPSDRSVNWQGVGLGYCDASHSIYYSQSTCEAVGGTWFISIPTRTTVYTTITASSGDRTSEIQTALNNCPAGQVVLLGAGSFDVTTITIPSGVVLRGAGIDSTIINTLDYADNYQVIRIGTDYSLDTGAEISLASGYTKGSTTLVTSTVHGLSAGDVIQIDETDDSDGDPVVTALDGETGSCTWCTRDEGTRPRGQTNRVVSVTNSTTIELEKPLYWTLDSNKSPEIIKLNNVVSFIGVEDLTIENSTNYYYRTKGNIYITKAVNCWIHNVLINGYSYAGIRTHSFYRIEISNTRITHSRSFGPGSYAIDMSYAGSLALVTNNVFDESASGPDLGGAISGNVYSYNYITAIHNAAYGATRYGLGIHGGHPFMILYEGNYLNGCFIDNDWTWGSGSHTTIFRNKIIPTTVYGLHLSIALGKNQTYHNIIGNLLGYGDETLYDYNGSPYGPKTIYALNAPETTDYGTARSTLLRHANYINMDGTENDGQRWCDENLTPAAPGCFGATALEHTLPDSLYLTTKPSWYVGTWPPVDPSGTTDSARYSIIPAQYYYENGSWPSESEDTTSPAAPSGLSVN